PGSRSTPLAMLAVENESIRDWILVDERSASYFALGLAKQTNRPVALICTSGTAAANYYPAVIEAYHGRVPLLLLTADRPQASREMLDYVRNRAQRAYFYAKEGNPGPVQLNFPIREPLTPDLTLPALFGQPSMRQDKVTIGKKVLATEEINNFIDVLKNKQKP